MKHFKIPVRESSWKLAHVAAESLEDALKAAEKITTADVESMEQIGRPTYKVCNLSTAIDYNPTENDQS